MKLKNLKTLHRDSYDKIKHLGRKSKKSTRHMIVAINDVAEKNIFEPISEDSHYLFDSMNILDIKSLLPNQKFHHQVVPSPRRQLSTGSSTESAFTLHSDKRQTLLLSRAYSGETLSHSCSQRGLKEAEKAESKTGPKYIKSSTSRNTLVSSNSKRPFFKPNPKPCLIAKLYNGESTGSDKGDVIWSIVFYLISALLGIFLLGFLIYCIVIVIEAFVLFSS